MSQMPLPFPRSDGPTTIVFGGASHCIVQNSDKVGIDDFLRYHVGCHIVGKVHVTFDVKDLPPELHTSALQYLLCHRTSIDVSHVAHRYWPEKYSRVDGALSVVEAGAVGALSLAGDASHGALSLARGGASTASRGIRGWWSRLKGFLRLRRA